MDGHFSKDENRRSFYNERKWMDFLIRTVIVGNFSKDAHAFSWMRFHGHLSKDATGKYERRLIFILIITVMIGHTGRYWKLFFKVNLSSLTTIRVPPSVIVYFVTVHLNGYFSKDAHELSLTVFLV